MKKRPYDPKDPFNMVAEECRQSVLKACCEVMRVNNDALHQLSRQRQTEAVLAGLCVGMTSVAFANVSEVDHDRVMEFIHAYLKNDAVPMAKQMQQDIQASGALNKPH